MRDTLKIQTIPNSLNSFLTGTHNPHLRIRGADFVYGSAYLYPLGDNTEIFA